MSTFKNSSDVTDYIWNNKFTWLFIGVTLLSLIIKEIYNILHERKMENPGCILYLIMFLYSMYKFLKTEFYI